MKYWGYLLAKLVAGFGFLAGLRAIVRWLLPEPQEYVTYNNLNPIGHDLTHTIAYFVYFLVCAGVIALIFWDQKYRCRTCARKLMMPVQRGSWDSMLRLGRPHMEYICPYGHGTLKVPELQITGKEPIAWAEHQDIWKELEELHSGKR
ncbi:MAG: hypothetical protein JNL62_04960 [Bryobacterales bacterium]|nr:hypothetical protein [Bryobacterales bacterium]